MDSSTSHSEPRFPLRALALLAAALAAWLLCAAYTVTLNPDLEYWRTALRLKRAWAAKLDASAEPKIVIAGGSSGAFSLDPEYLAQTHGLRVANMSLAATLGAPLLCEAALHECRRGDTLVVALEPQLLAKDMRRVTVSVQFARAAGRDDLLAGFRVAGDPRNPIREALSLRPGGLHACVMTGKLLRRQPSYRYDVRELTAAGFAIAPGGYTLDPVGEFDPQISAGGRALLAWLRDQAAARGVQLRYSQPWLLYAKDSAAESQRKLAAMLAGVSAYMPVIKDPAFGVIEDPALFADTVLHLSPAGARARADSFAAQLKSGALWQPAELEAAAR